jgi:flagellar hook-length control protein FliK
MGIPAEAQTAQVDGGERVAAFQPLPLLENGKTAIPEIADAVSDVAASISHASNLLSDQTNSAIDKNLQQPVASPRKCFVGIHSEVGNPQVQEQVQVNPGTTDSPAATVLHSDAEKHGQEQSSFADLTMPTMRSAVISVSPSTVPPATGQAHSVHGGTRPAPAADSSSSSSSGSSSGQTNDQEGSTNDGVAGQRSASTADTGPTNATNHGSSKSEGPEAIVETKSIPTPEVANAPGITATLATPPVARDGAPVESAQPQPSQTSNVWPAQLSDNESISRGIISNAQLMDVSGRGEMRIAMDTEKLGVIELRAHIVGDTVGAAITVEKRDVHNALTLELPTLQQALNDKQFRVEQITLMHSSSDSMMSDGNASAKQDNRATAGPQRSWMGENREFSSEFLVTENDEVFDSLGRLSVRA